MSSTTPSHFPPLKNDLLLRVARGERVERAPVWVMRQAGRYLPEFRKVRETADFFTMCRTPALASKVTLQPIERYAYLDAAIIFSDILVVPQALGMEVTMVPGKGPHFPNPLRTPEDVDRLAKEVDISKELGYVMDALTLCRHELQGRVPLFGFSGAPWTLMAYMIEGGGSKTLADAKTWLYRWPEASHALLQRLTDLIVPYLVAQVRAGAQILQVFESWGGELSPQAFSTFSLPYLRQIAERVKQEVDVSMVIFAKGSHYAVEDLALTTAYNIISLDWTMDPTLVRSRIAAASSQAKADAVVLQGNMDPSILLGGKDAIVQEVNRLAKAFGGGKGGWVANLGHGMYPQHDPEALGIFLKAIHDATSS
ncbi:MAG: uroporphyrinogen decarboxylase [Piptocephalis tieghemiana]|nr:MAG: uroporphyrinogen decarboxylase [Piptocephalis tieghemiana]